MTTLHTEAPTIVREPAADGGLAAELLARRRKRMPALTLALVVLVAAAAAFLGGVEIQKHFGKSTSRSSGVPAAFARFAASGGVPSGAASGAPSGFPGLAGGGGTSGTVTLIKGSTLYVTTASGNTVLVKTSTRSRVTKSVSGSVKSIHPGDSVTVVGSQGRNGTVAAQRITIGGGNG